MTPTNEHDTSKIDNFICEIERRVDGQPLHIAADRAFSSLGLIAKLAKRDIYLVVTYKKNMKGFRFLS